VGAEINRRCLWSTITSVKESYYVSNLHDICTGTSSKKDAQALKSDLIYILSQFSLELKKWASNSSQLLENILSEDKAAGSLLFNVDNSLQVQILGMKWDPDVNTFNYSISSIKFVSSKCSIMSVIAWTFDPLGFLSLVIFHAKHQLQWSGVLWDDRLLLELESPCMSFSRVTLSIYDSIHDSRCKVKFNPVISEVFTVTTEVMLYLRSYLTSRWNRQRIIEKRATGYTTYNDYHEM